MCHRRAPLLALATVCALQADPRDARACSPQDCATFTTALPADGSTGVALNSELRVRYAGSGRDVDSQAWDLTAVRLVAVDGDARQLSAARLAGRDSSEWWMVARPAETLAAGTEYELQVLLGRGAGACDAQRDWTTVSRFTTGSSVDEGTPVFEGITRLSYGARRHLGDVCGDSDTIAIVPELARVQDESVLTHYNVYVDGEVRDRFLPSMETQAGSALNIDCSLAATRLSILPGSALEVRAVDLAGNESAPGAVFDVADCGVNGAVESMEGCSLSRGGSAGLSPLLGLSLLVLWHGRRMQRRLSRLLMALLALLGSGCVEDASQCAAACIDGFQVSLQSPSPLPAGEYEIAVTLPDEVIVCHRTVPENTDVAPPDCVSSRRVEVGGVQPTQSGQTGFFISTRETPETLAVSLRRGNETLASESFQPIYVRSEICGTSCRYAPSHIVTLPAFVDSDAGADAN
jgi:hypothetical protein